MRFLLPAPIYDDSFAENVAFTLRQMGHEVVEATITSVGKYGTALGALTDRGLRYIFNNAPLPKDRALLSLARKTSPQVLLALTWDVHPEILAQMKRELGMRCVLWWGDPPANSQRWGLANPGWDFVFVKDRDACLKLRMAGTRAEVLHEALNPEWHQPVAEQSTDSIAVVGNFYNFRQRIVDRLIKDGVPLKLYGSRPPRWSLPRVNQSWTGRYVTKREKSQVFGESLACLNSFSFAEGNSLNCRAFEIAGAQGLQFIEDRPVIQECFEPGKELLTFSTYDELLELHRRAKSNDPELQEVRKRGARRAHAHHTYAHRLNEMMTTMSAG